MPAGFFVTAAKLGANLTVFLSCIIAANLTVFLCSKISANLTVFRWSKIVANFRSQTCKCKKGSDWLKSRVEAQNNIFKL